MHVESEDRVARSMDEVYTLLRDELPQLLPYLPDVESVVQVSREPEGEGAWHVVNRWQAKAAIPAMAAKFLPDNLLHWDDDAHWDDANHRVDFVLTGFGYEVRGRNQLSADGDGTIIALSADITIHPEKFKVPKLLFRKVFPLIENTVKAALQPNLTALARGVQQYYAEKA